MRETLGRAKVACSVQTDSPRPPRSFAEEKVESGVWACCAREEPALIPSSEPVAGFASGRFPKPVSFVSRAFHRRRLRPEVETENGANNGRRLRPEVDTEAAATADVNMGARPCPILSKIGLPTHSRALRGTCSDLR